MAFFPAAVPTTAQLLVAKNNTKVLLDVAAGVGDTTLTVDDASPLDATGYLTFDDNDDNPETISYTGKSGNDLTGVTRGDDNTVASTHSGGSTVGLEMRWNAKYHNVLAEEMIAIAGNIRNRFGLNTNIVVPTGVAFQVTDGLGIGGALTSKAILSLTSTTLGFLPPRMTSTQRDAIVSPPEGLIIANTSTNKHNYYNGSGWKAHVTSGDIVNADVASGAAIAVNKLAALTVSSLVASDASGFLTVVAGVSATEAGYLDGVTSAIQTQLDAKAALAGAVFTGDVTMDNQKGIKFREGSGGGTNFAKIQAPATLAGDYTLTLPVDDGTANQGLVTDGSGVLSWADVVTGTNQPQNILINGGFDFWQRNTSFSAPADATYTADRWKTYTDEAANVTVTQEPTTVDSGPYSYKVVVASAGASKSWAIFQVVENYQQYKGLAVTCTARVKSSVASAIKLCINDGVTTTESSYHTGGGSFETLTVTKTLSASAASLNIFLGMFDAGDKKNGTYYFDSVMFVLGSVAVTYVPKNTQMEFAQCQRYYEKGYPIATIPGANVGSAAAVVAAVTSASRTVSEYWQYKVEKRTTPTLRTWTLNGTISNIDWIDTGGTNHAVASDVAVSDVKGFNLRQTTSATYTFANFGFDADAEL